MKAISSLFVSALISSVCFASIIPGSYQCNDGGTLYLEGGGGYFYAGLEYPDRSVSPLEVMKFQSSGRQGDLLSKDDLAVIGTFEMTESGDMFKLSFSSGTSAACQKAD